MLANLIQACAELAAAVYEHQIDKRRLIKSEAEALIKQAGPSAFKTAQQVAGLARQRGDKASTEMWLEVAKEITRQEYRSHRRSLLSIIVKR